MKGLAFMVCAGVAGVVAAQFITSPADRAAATAPPAPPVLTGPVEHRVLSTTVVAHGEVRSSGLIEATPSSAYQAEVLTLTRRVVGVGGQVRPGAVLVEVSGRPLIALPGALPAYRSLRRGDQGDDVRQLQTALRSIGHATGVDRSGEFGRGTARALRLLYAGAGYAPATDGPGNAVTLPVAEVLYVPEFPARVEAINGAVGAELEAPTVRISHGELTVTARVRPTDAALLERGHRVELMGELDGRQRRGEVRKVGRLVTTDEGAWVPVDILARKDLPSRWNDSDVTVRIEVPVTDDRVLVVPVSAVSTGADGSTVVTVVADDAAPAVVAVEAGVSAGGFVEIVTDDERVEDGAVVVVGHG